MPRRDKGKRRSAGEFELWYEKYRNSFLHTLNTDYSTAETFLNRRLAHKAFSNGWSPEVAGEHHADRLISKGEI